MAITPKQIANVLKDELYSYLTQNLDYTAQLLHSGGGLELYFSKKVSYFLYKNKIHEQVFLKFKKSLNLSDTTAVGCEIDKIDVAIVHCQSKKFSGINLAEFQLKYMVNDNTIKHEDSDFGGKIKQITDELKDFIEKRTSFQFKTISKFKNFCFIIPILLDYKVLNNPQNNPVKYVYKKKAPSFGVAEQYLLNLKRSLNLTGVEGKIRNIKFMDINHTLWFGIWYPK